MRRMDQTFFVTAITRQRQALFRESAAAALLTEILLQFRAQEKYLLHEFVVMPDHFHALLTPAPELSLERAVQLIQGGFSFRLRASWPVWEPGFLDQRIRDAADFARHQEYVWMNPVRAGLARRAEEFAHSSASGRFVLDPGPGLKPLFDDRWTPA
jgi:putative transposase